ncbi:peptidase inhibitor family I36 protein [Nonomuraea endophytica]|uniref:peptidase inhibitor family I36 protein n=1 Tax=Nonomuraea endophytica TaxID=714136 RepID=UPI0037C896F9
MRALFLSIVAFFIMTGLPAPAQASAAPGYCPGGSVCLYTSPGGLGKRVCAQPYSTRVTCHNVRSAYNHGVNDPGKNDVRLYNGADVEIACVRRGQVKNLPSAISVFRVKWGTC